jgi:hypothetical protein
VAHGFVVHRYREAYAPGMEDGAWVPTVVANGWVIITTDKGKGDRIMLRTLAKYEATAIMFAPKGPAAETAALLLENERRISRAIEVNEPPLGLYVTKTGVTAHDFVTGGPRLRVLGNGKLKRE